MNSFRAVERAIDYEIERQAAALDAGQPLVMETRGWDDGKQATYRMRAKETSDDYRYFPEPDLPPLHVDAAWIDGIRAALPELPAVRRARYMALGLGAYDAAVIVADPAMTTAFEAISAAGPAPAKEVSNFVTGAHARAAKAGGLNAAGTAGSSSPAGIADAALRDRVRPGLQADRAGPAGPPPGGRDVPGRAPRLGRTRTHLGRRGAPRAHRRRHRREPRCRRGLSRGQAGGRLLRRPGHEGDGRRGGRGPGHHAGPRAPRRGRVTG